jgi:hypothetical protein
MPEFGNRGDSGGLSKPVTGIDAALARSPGSQTPRFKCGEHRGQQWGDMAEALHAEFVGPRKDRDPNGPRPALAGLGRAGLFRPAR